MGVLGGAGRCIGHQGGARRFREEEGGALRKVIFNLIVLENSIRRRCVNDTAKLDSVLSRTLWSLTPRCQ